MGTEGVVYWKKEKKRRRRRRRRYSERILANVNLASMI
jgi:hypothetical protein